MSTPNVNNATQWGRVGILFVVGCTLAFHIGKVPAALPSLSQQLNLTLFDSSWIVSVFSILIACLGLLIGLFAGRLNYLVAATVGLCLAGTGSLLGSFATTLPLLLVARACEGLGWILTAVSIPALLGCVSNPRDRSFVLGIWGAFMPAGMTVALLASPAIMAAVDWEGLWIIASLVSFAAAISVMIVCRDLAVPPAHQLSVTATIAVARQRVPLLMAGCFLVYSAQFLAVTAFMPTLLLEKYNVTIEIAAFLGALVIAVNAIGNVSSGWLLSRRVPRHYILSFAMVSMFLLALVIYPDSIPLVIRVVAAVGFSAVGGLIPGTLFATAPLVVKNPLHVGIINGLILQAAGTGQVLGPPVLTGIVEATGTWASASVFTASACAMGLICALMLGKSELAPDNL